MIKLSRRPPFWKRQYIVDKKLQGTLLTFIAILVIVIFGCLYFSNVLVEGNLMTMAENMDTSSQAHVMNEIKNQSQFIFTTYLIFGVLIACYTAFMGVILSNQIAGPIYRLRMHLQKVEVTGELEEITFRKNDYFSDLADDFNKAVKKLKND
jgi:nitrogen fixation/metabolism regulation signal transduction histidine kinase